MTPKEKAGELVEKFANSNQEDYCTDVFEASQQMANVAVNEILYLMIKTFDWDEKTNGNIHFWQEVKEEIFNL